MADPQAYEFNIRTALAKVAILDMVTATRYNDNGTVTIYVNVPTEECYEEIVTLLHQYAPGLRGEIVKGTAGAGTAGGLRLN